jgi:hypothetical protein
VWPENNFRCVQFCVVAMLFRCVQFCVVAMLFRSWRCLRTPNLVFIVLRFLLICIYETHFQWIDFNDSLYGEYLIEAVAGVILELHLSEFRKQWKPKIKYRSWVVSASVLYLGFLIQILAKRLTFLTELFCGSPQSLQVSGGIVP